MLIQLEIENFAIIEKVRANFDHNLNVMSGETGAGKSIILDAIEIILGGRINKNQIRKGKERATMRGVFLKNKETEEKLNSLNIHSEDDYITVERTFNIKGKSVIKINGSIQTNQTLKELMNGLVDICGQRDAQKLFKEETYLNILDKKSGTNTLNEYKEIFKEYKTIKSELDALKEDDRNQEQMMDYYKFQLKEIEEAKLTEEEEEELENQKKFLENFEKINKHATNVIKGMTATENIYDAMINLEDLVEKDNTLEKTLNAMKNAYYELQEVKNDVETYYDSIEFDEYEMNKTIERLEEIKKMKRKYGDSVADILKHYEEIKEKVEKEENKEEDILYLEKILETKEKEIKNISKKLTTERKENGRKVTEQLEKELKELCIENASVEFEIQESPNYTKNGKDKIELMFSANKGQERQPLSKVASGGEVSRVMLALKLIDDVRENKTMVFDEVDVGVGGEVGRVIGEKLKTLGEKTQVLCISHLPQVAAKGQHHFLIKKATQNEETVSTVEKLNQKERIEEIARMIYGDEKTEITLKQAEEMLG